MPGERDGRIWLGVERVAGERPKRAALIEHVVDSEAPALVYAATSRHCEELTEGLLQRDLRAAACHADRRRTCRHQQQARDENGRGLAVRQGATFPGRPARIRREKSGAWSAAWAAALT